MFFPSWTSLPPPTPSHPSRLLQSPGLLSLSHEANSHWLSILHMVMCMFPCYSLLFFKNLLMGISKLSVVEVQEKENTEELVWNLFLLFLMSHLLIQNLQLKVRRDKNRNSEPIKKEGSWETEFSTGSLEACTLEVEVKWNCSQPKSSAYSAQPLTELRRPVCVLTASLKWK